MAAAEPEVRLMIAGHFGFAALAKSREPQVPLWSLMLATVWLDIVFIPLYLAGIETIELIPGSHGTYGTGIIHADYTHSLLGALAISAIYGLAFAPRWGRRNAIVLAAVSFSHWVLDLLVHHGDMPLLPGNAGHLPKLGLGLWSHPPVVMAMELALVLAGAVFYSRAASRAVEAAGRGGSKLATVNTWLIALGGIAVLALDVTGALG
jgi:hypothetical protein